jgi:glycosyltransferase involved in cell wall biosynthesis
MINTETENIATAQRKKRLAEDRKIIVESGLFDAQYYLGAYPDVANAEIDPLDHYVEWGGKEGRRPHPLFDPIIYAMRYPDVLGSGVHPLVHYWTTGRLKRASCVIGPRLLGVVSNVISEAGALEPTILLDSALADPSRLAVNSGAIRWTGLHAWRSLFDSLKHSYEHIVFAPSAADEATDIAIANAVKAAIEAKGVDSTLVVVTDTESTEAFDWLPAGTHIRVLSELGKDLTRVDRGLIVENLIFAIRPRSVLNINSVACWDAFVRKGAALSRATNLYAYLVFREPSQCEYTGHADIHFRDALPHLRTIYFDNSRSREDLANDSRVPCSVRERLVTLHQPVSNNASANHHGGPTVRNKIIWAERFCAQQNIDLLLEIVANAPDLSFDVFGHGDDTFIKTMDNAVRKYSNLTLRGPFSSLADLQLDNYNAFLYTSLWDGLPPILVEVANIGIPVVASAVGGIPDLIKPSTGWLIDEYRSPGPYIDALRQICNDPQLARSKSAAMMHWVNAKHSWKKFAGALYSSASFLA